MTVGVFSSSINRFRCGYHIQIEDSFFTQSPTTRKQIFGETSRQPRRRRKLWGGESNQIPQNENSNQDGRHDGRTNPYWLYYRYCTVRCAGVENDAHTKASEILPRDRFSFRRCWYPLYVEWKDCIQNLFDPSHFSANKYMPPCGSES